MHANDGLEMAGYHKLIQGCGEITQKGAMSTPRKDDESMTLSDLESGARAVVSRLTGGRGFVNRLAALGFTVGAEVQVIQNYKRGPVIVLIRDTRVALGRGEALKVFVEKMDEL